MKKVVGAFICVLAIPLLAYAVVPLTANYQGYLTSAGGTPVNGTVSMTFSLYMAPSGGSPIWSETQSVSVDNGVYSVVLGAFNPLSLPFDAQYYLGVTVGADPEMVPRQALTSVPYAINADSAEVGLDLICSGCVSLSELNFTPGDITSVTAGTGLTGGGTSGPVTLNVNPAVIQSRVSGTCAAGSSIRTINQNGTVVCETDTDTNTTYSAGTGLDLVGTTFSVEEPLSLTGNHSGAVILGYNNYAGSGYGLYGYASGDTGRGVYGFATSTGTSTNFGGYFVAQGTTGRGVQGYANNSGTGINYGGFFQANGTTGRAVYGSASNTATGTNYGGYFVAGGTAGRGAYGTAGGTNAVGLYGTASGVYGTGVYGQATNSSSLAGNYGGYFTAAGPSGQGVHAVASGSIGRAVYGDATGTSAINYGGWFRASGVGGQAVYGAATNTGSTTNYGGYFIASGSYGYAVRGWATSSAAGTSMGGNFSSATTNGRGVLASATGSSGIGVYGMGNAYDFYAAGAGTNYGSSSSIRWKNNIVEIDNALDKVLSLRGVYFDWDEEHGGQHDMGFIAEEVGAVIPEIVSFEEDGVYATGVDYGAITPVLVQAIKEQQKLINELKAEIEALKQRM